MTPTIGLFVISSNMNLFDIDAISLSISKSSSPDSINFNRITKSLLTPAPFDNNNLLKLFGLKPH